MGDRLATTHGSKSGGGLDVPLLWGGAKKSPSGHHPTRLSGYITYQQSEKNLSSANISPICPHNMVNFGLLAAEINPVVWAPLQISTGFASWQPYCTALQYWALATLCGVEQRAHLYSAGRPSRWALAHILVVSSSVVR